MLKALTLVVFAVITIIGPSPVLAQELVRDEVNTAKARVLQILDEGERVIPGTEASSIFQTIRAEILDGPKSGEVVMVENDYLGLEEGDTFYLRHMVNGLDGTEFYSVADPYRLNVLYFFIGLFVLCVVVFGGKQGLRGLVSLVGSLALIMYVLLPGILAGYSPILLSMTVASFIVILGSYVTHGFNRVTSSAVIGMVVTIIISGLLAYLAIYFGRLSGFSDDESVYLHMNTGGVIDFSGLLLGGILIGLLGVLYDAAIGQAVAVDELSQVGASTPRTEIFRRAVRIGREHIGALVNTLAIAYVGASLPILLLFYQSSAGTSLIINSEIFATEIIRAMIGSIGIVLAVPITTAVAVAILVKRKGRNQD